MNIIFVIAIIIVALLILLILVVGKEPQDVIELSLQPGYEALTPIQLVRDQRYKITISGVYRYRCWLVWYEADACFEQAGLNFDTRYHKLFFDGKPSGAPVFEEDRYLHRYSFPITGTGKRLSILFHPPTKRQPVTEGGLKATITPLSEEEHLVLDGVERDTLAGQEQLLIEAERARIEAARQQRRELRAERSRAAAARRQQEEEQLRREQERRRQEAKQRAEAIKNKRDQKAQAQKLEEERRRAQQERERVEQQAHQAALQEQVMGLQIRSHLEGNVLDQQYRENLTTNHREKVFGLRRVIFEEYTQLMRNGDLIGTVRQQAPRVLEFLEAQVELVKLAERKEAERSSRPPIRTKPSETQIRGRKVYRKRRLARDVGAERRAILESAIEFRNSLEDYPLDEDEKERIFQDYYDEISSEEVGSGKKLE